MEVVLFVIAVIWIALATSLIIYTARTRAVLKQVMSGRHSKWLGLIPALFGLCLVIGAFDFRPIFWLAFALGCLALLKAAFFFVAPADQVRSLLDWWFERAGEPTLRLGALIMFALGIALLTRL